MSAESNAGCACADGTDDVDAVVPEVIDCGESAGAELPFEERCCRKRGGWTWVTFVLMGCGLVEERERGGVRS